MLFVIEGIDSSGKSTVSAQLVDMLNKAGKKAVLLSEPTYQSSFGKKVRRHLDDHIAIEPNELIELFMKDRAYDVEHNILPAIESNKIVVLDRYMTSSAVYECTDEYPWKRILKINRERFPEPDIIFLLKCGVEVAWKRAILRGLPLSQYETKAEMYRLQDIYDEILENDAIGNYVVVDSSGEHAHETAQNIYSHIKAYNGWGEKQK